MKKKTSNHCNLQKPQNDKPQQITAKGWRTVVCGQLQRHLMQTVIYVKTTTLDGEMLNNKLELDLCLLYVICNLLLIIV